MEDFVVREAVPLDAAELSCLEEICFPSDRITCRQFKYLIRQGRVVFLVITAMGTGGITGYGVCLVSSGRNVARLYSLAVLPEYRGGGVGRLLLESLLTRVKERGFSWCSLEVRLGAVGVQRLYESFGFEVHSCLKNYYEDGEDALRMRVKF